MKRISGVISLFAICFIVLGVTNSANSAPQLSVDEKMQLWGELDKQYDESMEIAPLAMNDVKIKGDDFTVTNAEYMHQVETSKLAGYTGQAAEKRALDILLERYAIYHHALNMGYSISEEELDEYVAACRADMVGASNIDDFYHYLEAREITEDEYWEYFKENRRYYCVIAKYKEPYYDAFREEHPGFDPTNSEDLASWDEQWNSIKEDAMEAQHVIVY